LVQEAARNDNFGVDHLEKLASVMQQLKEIHENRMPSVADLLKQAASAAASESKLEDAKDEQTTSVTDAPTNPGQSQAASDESEAQPDENTAPKPPTITMKESNMNAADEKANDEEEQDAEPSNTSPPSFKLPTVTVDRLPNQNKSNGGSCPAGNQMAAAVEQQEALLAEFQKVAEELQKLISNLEGSTFVKRLKALSRHELVMANDVSRTSLLAFGETLGKVGDSTRGRNELLAERQRAYVSTIENVLEDLSAYITRNGESKYKEVFEEMQNTNVVKQVGVVADRLVANEPGTSVAHAEWLADTFDRWAEQLVGPGCPGGT
jgi:hypothetical protein